MTENKATQERGPCCAYMLHRRFWHRAVRTPDPYTEGVQSDCISGGPGDPDPVYCAYDRDQVRYKTCKSSVTFE